MSAIEDRKNASDTLDDIAKALGAATGFAGNGMISNQLAIAMGNLSIEISKAANELTRTDRGVIVEFGKPNRRQRAARIA